MTFNRNSTFRLGWGSGSRNTENTGKYRSSILLNTENVQYRNFNTIEYWKCSIPKFQYYWIPKIFNTEISILLNTEKISILKFNSTKNFVISPDIPKTPKSTTFSAKEGNQFCFSKNLRNFFVICLVSFGIFNIDNKNTEFCDELNIEKKSKIQKM